MKHDLKISVSKKPTDDGIVSCRRISMRERVLRILLGKKQQLTVIIPGNSVERVSITELADGGGEGR